MSVLVNGMKMPESCGACKLSVQSSMSLGAVMRCCLVGVVGISYADPYDVLNKRHPNCPIVALPDKHGDLIDRDEAYDCIAEQEGGNYVDMDTVGKGLECATIIVEAEGEE